MAFNPDSMHSQRFLIAKIRRYFTAKWRWFEFGSVGI